MELRIKLFILLVIQNICIVHGQYQSVFGNLQTEWNHVSLYCDAVFVETYIHEKDTVVNNVKYHKINDWGLLRESDSNSKLWYRSFSNEKESLIMDLSLEKRDTFSVNSNDFIVNKVYMENNLKIIEFDYMPPHCGFYELLKFEESRGPNLSFKFLLSASDYDGKLLRCQTKDSITTIYLEQFGSDCRSVKTNTENDKVKDFQIHPNPFNNRLTIKSNDNKLRSIEIYNLAGVKIFEENEIENTVDINTEDYQIGIYIIKIHESNDSKIVKLVKTN